VELIPATGEMLIFPRGRFICLKVISRLAYPFILLAFSTFKMRKGMCSSLEKWGRPKGHVTHSMFINTVNSSAVESRAYLQASHAALYIPFFPGKSMK